MEPVSHFFYSDRLKLQFWDYGGDRKPAVILVHGGLDHARNWDWVAAGLCDEYQVYALDLRGHGNSAQARGAMYSIAEYVCDLSALLDVIGEFPVRLVGHSLGGLIVLHYAGIYPDRVHKLVNVEGFGFPKGHRVHAAYPDRLRRWIEGVRDSEKREPRAYASLEAAVARMKEANPHLSDEQARHLTMHGTNWNSDGSLVWKFDNYVRLFPPFGHNLDEIREVAGRITCPSLLFWGEESFLENPEKDGRIGWIPNARLVRVPHAGHWLHHDQLATFLKETRAFFAE
jgi:pimeloyl-ACP methyl ester carboxylesterase